MSNNDILLKDMGKRISERRKDMKLSQEELAELAEVSPQLLSTAERGTKALRPENLLKISTALGVSVDYLLTGEIMVREVPTSVPSRRIVQTAPSLNSGAHSQFREIFV